MWQAVIRDTLPAVIADLRLEDPDWEAITRSVDGLRRTVRTASLFLVTAEGERYTNTTLEFADAKNELEGLRDALRKQDIQNSLEHAETLARLLNVGETHISTASPRRTETLSPDNSLERY